MSEPTPSTFFADLESIEVAHKNWLQAVGQFRAIAEALPDDSAHRSLADTMLAQVVDCARIPPEPKTTPLRPGEVGWGELSVWLVGIVAAIAMVLSFGVNGCTFDRTIDDVIVEPVDPQPEADLVDEAFKTYESLFRAAQRDKAHKLRSGAFANEQQSFEWMKAQDIPKRAFADLLAYEFAQFGGEKWTAEKEAAVAEQWATGGGR